MKWSAIEDQAVGYRVVRAAAGQAETRVPCLRVGRVRYDEERFLIHRLHRCSEILVALFDGIVRSTGRTEPFDEVLGVDGPDHRLAALPDHVETDGVMGE